MVLTTDQVLVSELEVMRFSWFAVGPHLAWFNSCEESSLLAECLNIWGFPTLGNPSLVSLPTEPQVKLPWVLTLEGGMQLTAILGHNWLCSLTSEYVRHCCDDAPWRAKSNKEFQI